MDINNLDNDQLIKINKVLAKALIKKVIIGAAIATALAVTIAVMKSDNETIEITE